MVGRSLSPFSADVFLSRKDSCGKVNSEHDPAFTAFALRMGTSDLRSDLAQRFTKSRFEMSSGTESQRVRLGSVKRRPRRCLPLGHVRSLPVLKPRDTASEQRHPS